MADKRISQLVERTDIANNDVVPIVAFGATTTNKATISSIQEFMQENLDLGVTSVGITLGTTGTDVNVTGSPITTSGNITINIPDASATARGVVSTGTQTFAGAKTFNSDIIVNGVNVGRGGSSVPSNTRIGNSALQDNTTGGNNTSVGFASLIFTTTGSSNTAIGHQVLSNNNGSLNTGVGISSLFNLTTGSNNLGLGNQAGNQISGGANHTTSNNSIFIGSDTKPAANNQTNQIVIGHQSVGQGSNTVTIGNSDITSNKLFGRVIHADAVNADESATLGQVSTSLSGYVTLGTPQTITGQKTFNSTIVGQDSTLTSSGSNPTLLVTHSSGSGIALDISKGGNGEGLRVTKTSGSGNAVTITGGALSAEAGQFSGDLQSATRVIAASGGESIILHPNSGGSTNRIEGSAGAPLHIVTNGSSLAFAAGGTTPQMILSNIGNLSLSGALNGTSASFTAAGQAVSFASNSNDVWTRYVPQSGNSWRIQATTGSIFGIYNENSASFPLTIASTGAATFSSSVTAASGINAIGQEKAFSWQRTAGTESDVYSLNANSSRAYLQNDTTSNVLMVWQEGGNVGIGTVSPGAQLDISTDVSATGAILRLSNQSNSILADQPHGTIQFFSGDNSSPADSVVSSIISAQATTSPNQAYLSFLTGNNTEKIRITSAGEVLIGTTTAGTDFTRTACATASKNGLGLVSTDDSSGGSFLVLRNSALSAIGSISRVGTTNAVAFMTTSDYRLKEDLQEIKGLEKVQAIKVYDYKWKSEESRMDGVLAHELAEVLPYAVNGEKDAVDEEGNDIMQGVDYSKIVPILIKAIQELKTEIDSLKNQMQ
jgi:hypothetical protein